MPEQKPMRRRTVFYCALDGERFALVNGKYRAYYPCPKYFAKNRGLGEEACANRLSLKEANAVYAGLERMEAEGTLKKGVEAELDHIYLLVASVAEDEVKVYVLNRKATNLF